MHILETEKLVDLGHGNVIEAGKYIIDDINGAQLLVLAGGGTMTPLLESRPFGEPLETGGDGWNDKRVFFNRAGGYGDLILLTPVLREIKSRWPRCHIAVCTMVNYGEVLKGLPFVDEIIPFPVPASKARSFDAWVFYENAIERNPRAKVLHMTDLFAEIAGIEIENGIDGEFLRTPEYRVSYKEGVWVNEAYPRIPGVKRVAIQLGASSAIRRYPAPLFFNAIRELCVRKWEVMLLGEKGEFQIDPKGIPPNLRDLSIAGLKFRQSAAVVNTADVFIGNDSGLLHIAGALGVPAVGLYGAFPWRLRTAYCPTTVALSGVGECSPCFHHVHMRQHFPENCPSKDKGICEVLGTIKPERIVATAEKIARDVSRAPAIE